MFAILIPVAIAVILVHLHQERDHQVGYLGAFIAIAAVLLLLGWLYDKREAKKNAEWDLPE
jgi:hypothetical protein